VEAGEDASRGGRRRVKTFLEGDRMARRFLMALLALVIGTGLLLAADGVVVKYDKEKDRLTVTIDGKEKEYQLTNKIHVYLPGDKEVKQKDRAKYLTKGVKVELVEEGKLSEINIKK
jgi:hypothetical protein